MTDTAIVFFFRQHYAGTVLAVIMCQCFGFSKVGRDMSYGSHRVVAPMPYWTVI